MGNVGTRLAGSALLLIGLCAACPQGASAADVPTLQWAAPAATSTWDGATACWANGKQLQAFIPGADAVFAGKPGTVTLGESLTAGTVQFAPDFVLTPGDNILTVKNVTGKGYTVRCDGRKGGLRIQGGGEFAGAMHGTGNVNLWLDGGTLKYTGVWQVADGGQASSYIYLSNGAKVVMEPTAQINNQMPDCIYARVLFIIGNGPGETFELHRDFRADYMGFPDLKTWGPNGFSVLFLKNAALVSHATESLPSVHKRSGNGNHTHHGVIAFWGGDNNLWLVDEEPQHYDGVVSARTALTLRTEKNLLLTGAYFEDSHCYFGSDHDEPTTFTKEGPATLALMGTQVYAPGSVLRVQQGTVGFYSNPGNPGDYFRSHFGDTKRNGVNLQVEVAQGAGITCQSPEGCAFAAITTDGAVTIDRGPIAIAGDCTSRSNANWQMPLPASPRPGQEAKPVVAVGGTLTQAGTLAVTLSRSTRPGSYALFTAKAFAGDFTLTLPAGYEGSYRDGVLTLTRTPAQ